MNPDVTSTDCRTRCSRWRELKKLVQMLALKLAGINIVLLHLAPQGSATNVQQLRHLLYASAGDASSMDNRLFSMAVKVRLAGSSEDAVSRP